MELRSGYLKAHGPADEAVDFVRRSGSGDAMAAPPSSAGSSDMLLEEALEALSPCVGSTVTPRTQSHELIRHEVEANVHGPASDGLLGDFTGTMTSAPPRPEPIQATPSAAVRAERTSSQMAATGKPCLVSAPYTCPPVETDASSRSAMGLLLLLLLQKQQQGQSHSMVPEDGRHDGHLGATESCEDFVADSEQHPTGRCTGHMTTYAPSGCRSDANTGAIWTTGADGGLKGPVSLPQDAEVDAAVQPTKGSSEDCDGVITCKPSRTLELPELPARPSPAPDEECVVRPMALPSRQCWPELSAAQAQIAALRAEYRKLVSSTRAAMTSCAQDVGRLCAMLSTAGKEHETRTTALQAALSKESARRRDLFNNLQEMRGNIRVFLRIRPPSSVDGPTDNGAATPSVHASSPTEVVVRDPRSQQPKIFELDAVFGPASTQEEVFREVEALVTSVIDGYDASIMAYGQTGSGKTFTMEGSAENPGINPRALAELFRIKTQKEADSLATVDVTVSLIEVYNEQIRDLLAEPPPGTSKKQWTPPQLEVRQGEAGVYLPGAVSMPVNSLEDVQSIVSTGQRHRSVTATKCNAASSRSHSIVLVSVKTIDAVSEVATTSKLILVDLAGSERLNKSGAEGAALKEAQNINKSLSCLGDVIAALKARQDGKAAGKTQEGHIPFRNSKLTYLLQAALGPENKCLMVVQVSPDAKDVSETVCSLNFAARVNNVQLGPCKAHGGKGDVRALRDAVSRARSEVAQVEASKQEVVQKGKALKAELERLREAHAATMDEMAQLRRDVGERDKAAQAVVEENEQLKQDLRAAVTTDSQAKQSMLELQRDTQQLTELQRENHRLKAALQEAARERLMAPPPPTSLRPYESSTPLRVAQQAPPSGPLAMATGYMEHRPASLYVPRRPFLNGAALQQTTSLSRPPLAPTNALLSPPRPAGTGSSAAREDIVYVEPVTNKRPLPYEDVENMTPMRHNMTCGVEDAQVPIKKHKKVTFAVPGASPPVATPLRPLPYNGQMQPQSNTLLAPDTTYTADSYDDHHPAHPSTSYRLTPYKARPSAPPPPPSFLAPTSSSSANAASSASAATNMAQPARGAALGMPSRVHTAPAPTPRSLKRPARVLTAASHRQSILPHGPAGSRQTQGRWR